MDAPFFSFGKTSYLFRGFSAEDSSLGTLLLTVPSGFVGETATRNYSRRSKVSPLNGIMIIVFREVELFGAFNIDFRVKVAILIGFSPSLQYWCINTYTSVPRLVYDEVNTFIPAQSFLHPVCCSFMMADFLVLRSVTCASMNRTYYGESGAGSQ